MSNRDIEFMAQAIRLAQKGHYSTMPNPKVGCVLVRDGQVLAEGWHRIPGQGHAEVEALSAAEQGSVELKGATAYVTLEPCSHQGKTGPCCEALAASGVSRVVYGMEDPNPLVGGRGIEHLRDAGVEVHGPVLEDSCRDLNPGFIRRMESGKPRIRAKLAMSLDGRTAMANGESKWITTPTARQDVQRLRASSCAIVSGIESILQDNPAMTVRESELDLEPDASELATSAQPLRVVLDSQLRIAGNAQLFDFPGAILIVSLCVEAQADKVQALCEQHPQLEVVQGRDRDGRIDLHWLAQELGRRECNEVLVETGAELAGSFLRRGLLDEFIIYMAPKLLGSRARPIFELPLDTMAAHLPLTIDSITSVGRDWKIIVRPDMDS